MCRDVPSCAAARMRGGPQGAGYYRVIPGHPSKHGANTEPGRSRPLRKDRYCAGQAVPAVRREYRRSLPRAADTMCNRRCLSDKRRGGTMPRHRRKSWTTGVPAVYPRRTRRGPHRSEPDIRGLLLLPSGALAGPVSDADQAVRRLTSKAVTPKLRRHGTVLEPYRHRRPEIWTHLASSRSAGYADLLRELRPGVVDPTLFLFAADLAPGADA